MRLVAHALSSRPVERHLPARVGARAHRTDVRRGLELELEAEVQGRSLRGHGEASPLPGYSLDSLDEAGAALAALAWPLTLELDATLPAAVEDRCRALPPSARAALETALLDAAAQALERPLWRLLHDGPATALPLAAVVGADAGEPELEALERAGVRTLKCKLSWPPPRLPRFGARFSLRVDLNRALAPRDCLAAVPALAALSPSLVEEPLDGDLAAFLVEHAPAMRRLPLAADESLAARDAASALRAWERFRPVSDRLAAVVVKPSRDGVFGALALARAAASRGVPAIVSHLWDGATAHLAACHVAAALSSPRSLAQGLAAHATSMSDDRAGGALRGVLRGGVLAVPAAPGLGW